MSTRFVIAAAVGAGVGLLAGPVAGFQAGTVTYGVTGFLDPNVKQQGSRLSDLSAPSANAGDTIPYCEGHPRVPGMFAWASTKREVAKTTTTGGKGGPGVDSTEYSYEIDILYQLSENPGFKPRRIWSNGALVWSNADDADAETLAASGVTPSWRFLRAYDGLASQMPDPIYEAAVGVGNAPAYRGRSTLFLEGLNLGSGGYLPVLTFELSKVAAPSGPAVTKLESYFDGNDSTDISAYANGPGTLINAVISAGSINVVPHSTAPTYIDYGFPASLLIPLNTPTLIEFYISFGGSPSVEDLTFMNLILKDSSLFYRLSFYQDTGRVALSTTYFHHMFVSGPIVGRTHIRLVLGAVGPKLYINDILAYDNGGTPGYLPTGNWGVQLGMPFDEFSNGSTTNSENKSCSWSIDEFAIRAAETYDSTIPDHIAKPDIPSSGLLLVDDGLDQVVRRQCERAGLTDDKFDVTALATQFVRSMAVTQLSTPRSVIENLSLAYLFEAVETGDEIAFVPRGGVPVATVPYEDLGATADGSPVDDPLPIVRTNDIELPAKVVVTYSNVDNDYQTGSEQDDRGITQSAVVSKVEIPLGLTATEAKRIANIQITDIAASVRSVGPFAVGRRWSGRLKPTDPVLLERADGGLIRARVTKQTDADGVLTFEALFDDVAALDSTSETSTGYAPQTTIRQPTETDFEALDIPILHDADDDAGFYAAAKWDRGNGYNLLASGNDVDYSQVATGTQRSVFGVATSTLADWFGGVVWDERSRLTVNVGAGNRLYSYTRDDILAGTAPGYAIGSELVYARTATMTGDGMYTLSGFLRGRRGTEWAMTGHLPSERVALLDESLRRVPLTTAQAGVERYYKAVTFGRQVATTDSETFAGHAVGLMPFAPVDARGERLSDGSIRITWRRRTRLSARYGGPLGVNVPVGQSTEAYQVVIYKDGAPYRNLLIGADIVSSNPDLQTLPPGTPAAIYPASEQVSDFGSIRDTIDIQIYQLKPDGKGYPLVAHLRVA